MYEKEKGNNHYKTYINLCTFLCIKAFCLPESVKANLLSKYK